MPGVTRDRVAYDAEWAGRRFTLVDTGGWEVDATGIHLRVAEQAEVAVDLADAVLFVVDATVGATDTDEAVVRLLRRSGKPVVLVANKVDDQRTEADAAALWNLGLGQPWPVSALHGRGSGDLLDALLEVLPEVSAVGGAYERGGPRRVALLGRPNVGKSSLLNKLAGYERVVVDSVAGTTRDPVDELIELGGKTWRFVDTAGIRRRVHQTRGADFYASLRTQTALEKAEVAVVLVDAEEPIAEQDIRVIQQVVDAGRALVIAYNKWDLARRGAPPLPRARDRAGPRADPVGAAGEPLGAHRPAHGPARAGAGDSRWSRGTPASRPAGSTPSSARSSPAHPHPVRGGKQPRILFATQAGDPAAAVRALRVGVHRGGLPAVRRAPAARGVRLRGHADRGLGAGAGEAAPQVACRGTLGGLRPADPVVVAHLDLLDDRFDPVGGCGQWPREVSSRRSRSLMAPWSVPRPAARTVSQASWISCEMSRWCSKLSRSASASGSSVKAASSSLGLSSSQRGRPAACRPPQGATGRVSVRASSGADGLGARFRPPVCRALAFRSLSGRGATASRRPATGCGAAW